MTQTDLSDHGPVLTVDWDTIEDEIGRSVSEHDRRTIEVRGSTSYANDDGTDLFTAVGQNARIIHPTLDELDWQYVNTRSAPHLVSYIRAELGENLRLKEPIAAIDGEYRTPSYIDGIATLYKASKAIDEQGIDFFNGERPQIRNGSYGPDGLGDLYITCSTKTRDEIEKIDLTGLSIEREKIRHYDPASYREDVEEKYIATFRHERYYKTPWASLPYGKRTYRYLEACEDNAGLLDMNIGKTTFDSMAREQGVEPEKLDSVSVNHIARSVDIFGYEKDGTEKWVAEWVVVLGVDDYTIVTLIFDHYPRKRDIQTVNDVRFAKVNLRRGNVQIEFSCWECGRRSHWLDATGPEGEKLSLRERVESTGRRYCGC